MPIWINGLFLLIFGKIRVLETFRFYNQINEKSVRVPVTLMKVALRERKIRAVQVLMALKYCLGVDSMGHVALDKEGKRWLSNILNISLRSIDRDIEWLQEMHLIKEDRKGWRVCGTDRMHWNLVAKLGVDQSTSLYQKKNTNVSALHSPKGDEKETAKIKNQAKKPQGSRIYGFDLVLNFVLIPAKKLRKIFTTLIVAKNLRAQAFRQIQEMAKDGQIPKKWGDVQTIQTKGQTLSGEALALLLGISVRQAYILRAEAHLRCFPRTLIVPGCMDEDILLELGRSHFQTSGGVVYRSYGCLVFRASDLIVANYTGQVSSGRFRPHWSDHVNDDKVTEKGYYDSSLSKAMNMPPKEILPDNLHDLEDYPYNSSKFFGLIL